MTIKKAPYKPQTIKHTGRKYVVVNRSASCLLIKRAGKVQWFTLVDGKEGKPKRHADFWAALEAHSVNMEARGVPLHPITEEDAKSLQEADEALVNSLEAQA